MKLLNSRILNMSLFCRKLRITNDQIPTSEQFGNREYCEMENNIIMIEACSLITSLRNSIQHYLFIL